MIESKTIYNIQLLIVLSLILYFTVAQSVPTIKAQTNLREKCFPDTFKIQVPTGWNVHKQMTKKQRLLLLPRTTMQESI